MTETDLTCEVRYDVARTSNGMRATVTPTGGARFVCTIAGIDEHGPAAEMSRRQAACADSGHALTGDEQEPVSYEQALIRAARG